MQQTMVGDPAVAAQTARLVMALEQQMRALGAVQNRFERARALLPPADGDGVWRGVAHASYVSALSALAGQLSVADGLIERSLVESRSALESVRRG